MNTKAANKKSADFLIDGVKDVSENDYLRKSGHDVSFQLERGGRVRFTPRNGYEFDVIDHYGNTIGHAVTDTHFNASIPEGKLPVTFKCVNA